MANNPTDLLVEILTVPDTTTVANDFDEPIELTHRGFWYTVNVFLDQLSLVPADALVDRALIVYSVLGKFVEGVFRPAPETAITTEHTRAEANTLLSDADPVAAIVAAHKLAAGL